MLKFFIAVAMIFGIGACTGYNIQPQPEDHVEFIQVPHTVIVTETAKPDPQPVQPAELSDACLAAIKSADRVARHAESIFDSGTNQLAIISDARIALFDQDTTELQAITNRQNRLHSSTVGHLALMEESLLAMKRALQTCREQ
jgi:hypothetical protein